MKSSGPAARTARRPASSSAVPAAEAAAANKPANASASASASASKSKSASRARDDKDRPLFEDIRYLGRLLGDVVREQEGEAVYEVVEAIRQTAVRFRREDDHEAAKALDKQLRKLTPEQT